MSFLKILSHLLPTGEAFRVTTEKYLRKLFAGLSDLGADAKLYADEGYLDLFPDQTRELEEWEAFYGLTPGPNADEAKRRLILAAEWKSTGGQSPGYIQDVLRTAGYPFTVHEWWASTDPWVARDPRDYTEDPLIGSVQCSTDADVCGDPEAQCDAFLINNPGYFANLNLGPLAPPPVPSDSAKWPFFLYFGAETFPNSVAMSSDDRGDVERLISKLKPAQQWAVLLAEYVDDYVMVEPGDYVSVDSEGYVLVS